MEVEPRDTEQSSELERDLEAWNLPRGPVLRAGPPLEHWPERKTSFEAGLAELESEPPA